MPSGASHQHLRMSSGGVFSGDQFQRVAGEETLGNRNTRSVNDCLAVCSLPGNSSVVTRQQYHRVAHSASNCWLHFRQAMTPPFQPRCTSAADASHFDNFPPQPLPDVEDGLNQLNPMSMHYHVYAVVEVVSNVTSRTSHAWIPNSTGPSTSKTSKRRGRVKH